MKNDKTILCYGDSNTWGYSPATQDRYARDERWTGVLRQKLGDDPHNPRFIKTVWGTGYMFIAEEEQSVS